MATLTIEVTPSVLSELKSIATRRRCSVSQVAADKLAGAERPVAAGSSELDMERQARRRAELMAALETSGEVAPEGEQIALEGRTAGVRLSPAQRRALALKAAAAGPVSEAIIRDRG